MCLVQNVTFIIVYVSNCILSYDVSIIQWITSCHKNRMTTRVITLWRFYVTRWTTLVSTLSFLTEIMLILKAIKPQARFINFIWNDHEFKFLFIIWPFKTGFLSHSEWTIFQEENALSTWMLSWRYVYVPKCYYTCGHTIFMTWRYPLNNSDVIRYAAIQDL